MNKNLVYVGAGVLVLFLLFRKKASAKTTQVKNNAPAPANKPAPVTTAPVTTAPVTKTEPIFVDDRGLPSWEDVLVTPSTTPTVPLDRNLFEIPFSPTDILPKGLEYVDDY